jgi:nucleoside-diphosphate-sugar epimerase
MEEHQVIFITGSNGFVGKALIRECQKKNIKFVGADRKLYGDLTKQDHWEKFLEGVSAVVHLAARVHVMNEVDSDPLKAFREVNVLATLRLAEAAKKMKVRRFIFISSIKVNGEETPTRPFSADDVPAPQDPYGVSKYEAEKELMKLHEEGVFEVVIIRPPLIYGPGVKANFEKLMVFVKKDIPLPFGLVKNRRSLVSVYNLADLILMCVQNPKASGNVFLASDDESLSLKELLLKMGKVTKRYPHLVPVPVTLMKFAAKILGKEDYAHRLFGNLELNIDKTKTILNWKPPYTFEETFKNDY